MKIIRVSTVFLFMLLISCNNNAERALKQSKNSLLNNTYKAICYSGFRDGQHPDRGDGAVNPSYDEIVEDLKILSYNNNFKLIRLYDCGENSEMVLKAIQENKINIKVMLGIWLNAELSSHETCSWLTEPIPDSILLQNKLKNHIEIKRGIELSKKYNDIVIAVNVGNEALVDWNDHKVDTDTIISYVREVKSSIEQPVTVAENYKWWADFGENLVKEVDFIALHIYPVWEGKDIEEGLRYSIQNLLEVRNKYPDKQMVISEAGWASVASEFGDRASEHKQSQYFSEIMTMAQKMNITTFIFEAFDENWKGDSGNMLGAEKHWGLFTSDRKPKLVMKELYKNYIKN